MLLLGTWGQLKAQKCAFDRLQHELMAEEEQYRREVTEFEEQILEFQLGGQERSVGPYMIPVVVHIIHSGEPIGQGRNVSASRVLSQLDVLNEDFLRTNGDADETPSDFLSRAANTTIEFCLASTDPSGNPTEGILRHRYDNVSSIGYIRSVIKPQTIWDPLRYLNIWVLDMPDPTILGYSYLPTQTIVGSTRDGLVVNYLNFGVINNRNRGRTATHEIGHYLGLKHMWGDNDSNGNPLGCGSDDGISDTPNSSRSYFNCPFGSPSSCGSRDMFMNYMDYVDDDCMNLFTEGQASVMRGVLNGIRSQLIANSNTACTNECSNLTSDDIVMGFESNQSTSGWLVENTNGDNRTWIFTTDSNGDYGPENGTGMAAYFWNATEPADDYLFTPCFTIEANLIYEVEFSYACARDDNQLYTEAFEVGFSVNQSSSDFAVPNNSDDWRFDPVDNAYPNYQRAALRFISSSTVTLSLGFHVYSPPDKYALQIDNINIRYTGLTDVEEVAEVQQFDIQPNPTNDWFNVQLSFETPRDEIEVLLHDLTGRVIESRQLRNVGREALPFDLSDRPAGVYLLSIRDGRTVSTQRVVKL